MTKEVCTVCSGKGELSVDATIDHLERLLRESVVSSSKLLKEDNRMAVEGGMVSVAYPDPIEYISIKGELKL